MAVLNRAPSLDLDHHGIVRPQASFRRPSASLRRPAYTLL